MKMIGKTKPIVLSTLTLIYLSGVLVWALSHWFLHDNGFGPQPSAWRMTGLQAHSIIGLWFFVLFGYVFHSHVQPSWRRHRRRKSGFVFSAVIVVLFLTVPGLFLFNF